MKSKLIIGDVHGCYDTLMALVKKLPHNDIVFCGDLIDRGPKSMQVVDFVKNGGYDCVKGNHEDMMVVESGRLRFSGIWASNGGSQTIKSYTHREFDEKNLPNIIRDDVKINEHVEWMRDLPAFLEYPDIVDDKGRHLLVSHACVTPGTWKTRNTKWSTTYKRDEWLSNFLWSREFYSLKPLDNIYSVFGHTPQEWEPRIKSFYACVDTGAFYNKIPSHKPNPYGKLTALEFPVIDPKTGLFKVYQQENIDEEYVEE